MLKAIRPKNKVIVMYLFIPVLIYVFTVFIPLIAAFYFSFFKWKGGPKKTFIGKLCELINRQSILEFVWS